MKFTFEEHGIIKLSQSSIVVLFQSSFKELLKQTLERYGIFTEKDFIEKMMNYNLIRKSSKDDVVNMFLLMIYARLY